MGLIGVLVAGVIVGLLGKLIAPKGKDNTPLWLTVVCGIGGVLVGWYVYKAFGGNGSPGIDWTRWLVAVLVSVVFVMLASNLTRRSSRRRKLF
jgi:uncharacterized membrane protein YeaQ/YmgE (transglycosylase-associated protein family)